MIGMMYDFEAADIRFDVVGAIEKAVIDNQNCALIATSEVCRITRPEVGAYLFARVINRQAKDVKQLVADARRMVEADGGKQVYLAPVLDDHGRVANVTFKADYGEPYMFTGPDTVTLTYMLDYATPFSISRVYARGATVTLQTPEELGFVMTGTHTFQAWTYLGQDVTSVKLDGDTVVEARTERGLGPNLLRNSRAMSGYGTTYLSGSYAVFAPFTSSRVSLVTKNGVTGAEMTTIAGSGSISCVPTVPYVIPAGSTLAISMMLTALEDVGISWASASGSTLPTIKRFFIAGAEKAAGVYTRIAPGDGTVLVEIICETTRDFPANTVSVTSSRRAAVTLGKEPVTGSTGIRIELPKIEDVTGLPEEEQRATAWVPHVDDAI